MIPIWLAISGVVGAFMLGMSVGMSFSYWVGVQIGHGATVYPDSPYFTKERRSINSYRAKFGLPPVGDSQ